MDKTGKTDEDILFRCYVNAEKGDGTTEVQLKAMHEYAAQELDAYKSKTREAEAYADSVDRRGCAFWRGMYRGYIAGAIGYCDAETLEKRSSKFTDSLKETSQSPQSE